MSASAPILVYKPGQPDERAFPLGSGPATIGRGADQTVCILHQSLSRSHARIERAGVEHVIVDLGSTNGTLVNGVRVERATLRSGDAVKLGDIDFGFRIDPASVAPTPDAARARPRATCEMTQVVPSFGWRPTRGREGDHRVRERLRILIEVSKLLPVSDDIDSLLAKVLELVFQIVEVDRGAILLRDPSTGRLEPRVTKTSRPTAEGAPVYSQQIVEYVMRESVAALFADAPTDPRLRSRSVVAQSIHASMCAPLKPRDEVIGVLYVDNQRAPHLFTSDDLELFAAFAGQAAVALENAELYRRLERETVARMQLIMEAKLASLGAVVAGIAHEIRNPLNLMTNFGEIASGYAAELDETLDRVATSIPPDERAEAKDLVREIGQAAGRITEHGRRADAIIEAMLRHGRPASSDREQGDLNAVVAQSVRLACEGPVGRSLRVNVVLDLDPTLAPVPMSPLDIGRVVLNVADNAAYAMRDRLRSTPRGYVPELVVTTTTRPTGAELRVRDNGAGIPTGAIDRVFEPFFTTKPPGSGTGLGLSLSREIIVQGHQGTMTVSSEEGAWTEVVITLPHGTPTRPPPRT